MAGLTTIVENLDYFLPPQRYTSRMLTGERAVHCHVCGKPIEPGEGRYRRTLATGVVANFHVYCHERWSLQASEPPR
jgi:hypothetical protein